MHRYPTLRIAVLFSALVVLAACGDVVTVQERSDRGDDSTTTAMGEPLDLAPAIAYAQATDGDAILVLADTDGNVLQEVRDLPQHQFGRKRFRVEVAISPDGTRGVYEDSGEDRGNLYIRGIPDGKDRSLVVEEGHQDTNPVWSPDGEWIAFERNRNQHTEIFVVRPDGSGLRQLTETEDGAGLPVWSPDGAKIAFLSPPSWEALGYELDANPAEVTPFAIHVVNADGTGQRAMPGAEVFQPSDFASGNDPDTAQIWSPDSRNIVYTRYVELEDQAGAYPRLAIADVETGETEVVPNHDAYSPAWSPTQDRVAYLVQERAMFLYDTDSGETTRVLESNDWISNPQWSMDGEYLNYETSEGVYVMDDDGGERQLVGESTGLVSFSTWTRLPVDLASGPPEEPEPTPTIISTGDPPSPTNLDLATEDVTVGISDDQMLALAVERWVDGRRVMSVFDLDGNLLREFDEIPNIELEDAPPTIVADVSPDGRSVVYQHNYEDDGADIFVMGANDEEPGQLTSSGDNYRPVWSPDREQIAFLSDRAHSEERPASQRSEVFVMDADGSNLRQLSETPYGAGQIKWAHDGSMIAFASPGFHAAVDMPENERPPEYPFQLYAVDVESSEQRELEGATMEDLAGLGLAPQPWLTDNSGLFFERKGRAYIAWSDGSGVEEIDGLPNASETHQLSMSVSPDGRSLAFNWTQDDGDSPVGILDLEDGSVTELSPELTEALPAGWSMDGSLLAAITPGEPTDDLPQGSVWGELWAASPDDGAAQRVATDVTDNEVRWLVVPVR